jgi:hypothetical protein
MFTSFSILFTSFILGVNPVKRKHGVKPSMLQPDEYIQRIKKADSKTFIVWNENITKYADKTWPTPKEEFIPEYTEFFKVLKT